MQGSTATQTSSNFDLKSKDVGLISSTRTSELASVSLEDLEAIRVSSTVPSASKHGLETITGASCETGAQ